MAKQLSDPCRRAKDAISEFSNQTISDLTGIENTIHQLRHTKALTDKEVKDEVQKAKQRKRELSERWNSTLETIKHSYEDMTAEMKQISASEKKGKPTSSKTNDEFSLKGKAIPGAAQKRPHPDDAKQGVVKGKDESTKNTKSQSMITKPSGSSEDALTKVPTIHTVGGERAVSPRKTEEEDVNVADLQKILEERKVELDEYIKQNQEKDQQLNELKKKVDELQQSATSSSKELESKEKIIESLKKDKFTLNDNMETLKREADEVENRNQTLRTDLADNQRQLRQLEDDRDRLTKEVHQLQKSTQELKKELDYWKNKFGQLASDKVQSDPDVANLGDAHRALNIAEKYKSMYDGIWFKALRAQKKEGRKERDVVVNLRTILKEAFTYCEQLAMQQETTLNNVFLCPVQTKMDGNQARNLADKRLEIHLQKMKEVRKALSVGAVEDVKQAFWEDCKQKLSEMTDVDKKCMDKSKEYYLKCIEICWPMALHNPPLYIKMDVQHGEPVNLDLYTCRSSGDFVDIMVWPPLYQGEHGGLLAKGVVEGLKMVKKTGTAV